jgi:aminopeptidase-like protein
MAMLWVLNLSDGDHTLLEVADRAELPFAVIAEAARDLERAGLLSSPAAR